MRRDHPDQLTNQFVALIERREIDSGFAAERLRGRCWRWLGLRGRGGRWRVLTKTHEVDGNRRHRDDHAGQNPRSDPPPRRRLSSPGVVEFPGPPRILRFFRRFPNLQVEIVGHRVCYPAYRRTLTVPRHLSSAVPFISAFTR